MILAVAKYEINHFKTNIEDRSADKSEVWLYVSVIEAIDFEVLISRSLLSSNLHPFMCPMTLKDSRDSCMKR